MLMDAVVEIVVVGVFVGDIVDDEYENDANNSRNHLPRSTILPNHFPSFTKVFPLL